MWPVFGAGRLVTLTNGPASLEYRRRKRMAGVASRVFNRGGIMLEDLDCPRICRYDC